MVGNHYEYLPNEIERFHSRDRSIVEFPGERMNYAKTLIGAQLVTNYFNRLDSRDLSRINEVEIDPDVPAGFFSRRKKLVIRFRR